MLQQGTLPDAPGRDVVERVCASCHATEYIIEPPQTVPAWKDTLELMKSYGAEASDEDWKTVTSYIVVNLARLSVNKAPAEDIALVFAVDEQVAAKVVAYRDGQGGFKTVEDVKKAPGLDAARVDTVRERLIFE